MSLARTAFVVKSRTVRRSSGRYLDELSRNERLPLNRLLALQAQRAAALARFAAADSAFYRELYSGQGIDTARLELSDQWHRLPIIDRAQVKSNAGRLVSSEAGKRNTRDAKTGGSTGEPLRTKHDTRVPNLALAWRMYRWWGVDPWDDLARVARWGFGRTDEIKNRVTWWPSRQLYLDASVIDEGSMKRFHHQIVGVRPALIEGYAGAMTEFADFVESEGLELPGLRAVATTAAPLPESTRARLEGVFRAPVYDEYRGSEVPWMAGECREQNGLHVFADARLIEIVDDEGRTVPPGTVGDIVVTDLTNRVFPIIRYRLGDRGALREGACPCGVTLPLIDKPEGRTTDVLRLPSGKVLNQRLMAMFGSHPDAVRLFQIHQSADYAIRVRIVLGDDAEAERHIEDAVDELSRRIGHEVPVTTEFVASLPYTGGKTKYVISDVAAR